MKWFCADPEPQNKLLQLDPKQQNKLLKIDPEPQYKLLKLYPEPQNKLLKLYPEPQNKLLQLDTLMIKIADHPRRYTRSKTGSAQWFSCKQYIFSGKFSTTKNLKKKKVRHM